jgi:hypothetical protein
MVILIGTSFVNAGDLSGKIIYKWMIFCIAPITGWHLGFERHLTAMSPETIAKS